MKHSEQKIKDILNEVANKIFVIKFLDSFSIIYTPSNKGLNTKITIKGKGKLYISMLEIDSYFEELRTNKLEIDKLFITISPIDIETIEITAQIENQLSDK